MTREEAIDIIRKNLPHLGIGAAEMTEALNELIPELAESEDEMIRRWLVDIFKKVGKSWIHRDITCEQILEWLEKQKEQEHICDSAQYEEGFKTGLEIGLRKQKEQKPELVQQPPITYTYNSNASRDERLKAALLALLNSDLLKVKEGGYFTKQDLIEWVERIPTDKPAEWIEEDVPSREMILAIWELGNAWKERPVPEISQLKFIQDHWKESSYVNKLKSLRPSWKPSEEQMFVLRRFLKFLHECGSPDFGLMDSLIGKLKTL